MKYTAFFWIVIWILLLSSCAIGVPVSRGQPANNDSYRVDYLFEHDGCKVYRFLDADRYVYFTNCTGSTLSISADSTQTMVQTAGGGINGRILPV